MGNKTKLTKKTLWFTSVIWILPIIYQAYYHLIRHQNPFYNGAFKIDYMPALMAWRHGLPLYQFTGFNFVYYPTSAALLLPFSFITPSLSALIYICFSVFMFAYGCLQFCQVVKPEINNRAFLIVSIASSIYMINPIIDTQLHILTTGLMILGLAFIVKKQWWKAAIFFAIAVALKPTSLILSLLVFVLYPRVTFKLFITLIAIIALTFLLQHPTYVWQQYIGFYHNFLICMKYDKGHTTDWATLFNIIAYLFHYALSTKYQLIIRLIFSLFTLFFCYRVQRQNNNGMAAFAILLFGMSYLMIFNTRTENNDYIMILPAIGYAIALMQTLNYKWAGQLLVFFIFLFAANWTLCNWLNLENDRWLLPFITFIFYVGAVYAFISDNKEPELTPLNNEINSLECDLS